MTLPKAYGGDGETTWFDGAGAPSVSLGANGDYYHNTTNDDIHKKDAGSWSIVGSFDSDSGGDMTAATYDPATVEEQLVGETAAQTLSNKTLTEPLTEFIQDDSGGFDAHAAEFLASTWAFGGVPTAQPNAWVGIGGSQFAIAAVEARGTGSNVSLYLIPKGVGQIAVFGRGSIMTIFAITGETTAIGRLNVLQGGETAGVRVPVGLIAQDARNFGNGDAFWAALDIASDRGGDLSLLATKGAQTVPRRGDLNLASAGGDVNIESTEQDVNIAALVTNIDGSLLLRHTAAENDDHAAEIVCDASGFSDVKALDVDYITGAQSAGEDESIILVNVDDTLATGGVVTALEMLGTEGGAKLVGLHAGALVHPIEQLSGVFSNADSVLDNAVDVTIALSSGGAGNVSVFENDDETITVGEATKFEEIEFLLGTPSSGGGIAPTFEYSTGVGTWASFGPVDGTNGLRNTGVVAWMDSDISSWAVGTGSEYLIRITRTRNVLTTTPIVDKIQIAVGVEFSWNKDGDIVCNSLVSDIISNVTLNPNTGATPVIDWHVGNIQRMTLTAATTPTFTNPTGPAFLSIEVVQGGVGSFTVTWPSTVRWPGGVAPTLSTAVGAVDIVDFRWNGTNYDGSFNLNYS